MTTLGCGQLTASLDGGGTLSDGGQKVRASCLGRDVLAIVDTTQAVAALGAVRAGVCPGKPAGWALALAVVLVHHQLVLALGALVATGGGVQHTAAGITAGRAALVDLLQGAGAEGVVCKQA